MPSSRPPPAAQGVAPHFSLVVTCRGRLAHLRQSLPRFLAQPRTEVIVVDFDCPERSGDHVAREFPGVKIVRVPDQPYFNASAARNAGARQATAPHLFFCDADVLIASNVVEQLQAHLAERVFLTFRSAKGNSLGGTCIVARADFAAVEGFDEVIEGYGGEDLDFYWRLSRLGRQRMHCDATPAIQAIEHPVGLRTAEYQEKDLRKSFLHARAYRLAKETVLGLTLTGELPYAQRKRLWTDVGAALAQDRFEISVPLPGNMTSGILRDWTWKRTLLVSFARCADESGEQP